jgi:hypothetical protein
MHSPLEDPGAPAAVNGLIVHALTLLHPRLPQPDGGRMYRCLTEFPDRVPGCLVPLSTLNYELDDGRLWPDVADWQHVTSTLVHFTKTRGFCPTNPRHVAGSPPVAPKRGSPSRNRDPGAAGSGQVPLFGSGAGSRSIRMVTGAEAIIRPIAASH